MSRRKKRRVLRGAKLAAIIAPEIITHLFRDDFRTVEAAPLTSPRTAEPGPGILEFTDVGSNISINASDQLVIAQGTGVWNQTGFHSQGSVTRVAGLALLLDILNWDDNICRVGYTSVASEDQPGYNNLGLQRALDNLLRARGTVTASSPAIATLTDPDNVRIVTVLFSSGRAIFADFLAGAGWELLWLDRVNSTAALYGGATMNDAGDGLDLDTFRVIQLGGAFASDYGIATQRLAGARAPGDTFAHAADCDIEFTVTTLPAAAQIELWFRIQDATNYWTVTVDSTGALDLDEVVAGVPTQRGTAAGVIGAGERVFIRAHGATIDVYDSAAQRISYASASNFQTETDGELDTEGTGGAVDDIVSYPYFWGATFDKYFTGA